jgi:hypothetical protein
VGQRDRRDDLAQDALRALTEGGPLGKQALGMPLEVRATSATLLEAAKLAAVDPTVFDGREPVFWATLISNGQVDAYDTVMAPSTLGNFAADATSGVSFQDSHMTDSITRTFGRSLSGAYTQGANARVEADFYTVLGMDAAIDTWWQKLRAGITRDVSVGFYGAQYRCSICDRDMLRDWDCMHMPGGMYPKRGAADGEMVRAVAYVENARLAEVSTVYDGATPGAGVLKAYREANAGRLKPEAVDLIEQRYRIRLPRPARVIPVPTITSKERTVTLPKTGKLALDAAALTDEQREALEPFADLLAPIPEATSADPLTSVPLEELRGVLAEHGHAAVAAPVAKVREILKAHADYGAEIERLKPLAVDGEAYRKAEVEAAIVDGARALGKRWDEAKWRALLTAMPLEQVSTLRAGWADAGDAQFAGGRQTVDEESPKRTDHERPVPIDQYRVG